MNRLESITKVQEDFDNQIEAANARPLLTTAEEMRIQFLGKKGLLTGLMGLLKTAEPSQKKDIGRQLNILRKHIESSLSSLKSTAEQAAFAMQLSEDAIDVSLPANSQAGSLHPVSLIKREVIDIFKKLGFIVADGPEVDLDFYNFSALNIPDHHPARDMQDTFYIDNKASAGAQLFLRTHTSNVQIHTMSSMRPPLRVIAPGRTYRVDNDPTHTPMFHQVEGFVVDENVSMSNLKGILTLWLQQMFGHDIKIRLRPSYFPFVEPGAEMDMSCLICLKKQVSKNNKCRVCKGTGWLEIGGCGMIHPNVFEAVGYDSEQYTGLAFGFGLDRMAMLKYRLTDLRRFFDQSNEFLSQFPITTSLGS